MSHKILVIRFSALGDVAMTIPVLNQLIRSNPEIEVVLLTQKQFAPLFQHLESVEVIGVDLMNFKGLFGLLRLFRQLNKKYRFEKVVDLHQVLRSRILSFFFRSQGLPVFKINKGRRQKEKIIRDKEITQLPHTTERYTDTFRKAGLNMPDQNYQLPSLQFDGTTEKKVADFLHHHQGPYVAFAPFAKHLTKTLPLDQSSELIKKLAEQYSVFLLGGQGDQPAFQRWVESIPNVYSTVSLSLLEQTCLMGKMSAVISMDSANMHLAAIQSVPVVSIWGATHPCLGFNGVQTNPDGVVQTRENLTCRPCSVFGNKPCTNTERPYACLASISTNQILEALEKVTEKS